MIPSGSGRCCIAPLRQNAGLFALGTPAAFTASWGAGFSQVIVAALALIVVWRREKPGFWLGDSDSALNLKKPGFELLSESPSPFN